MFPYPFFFPSPRALMGPECSRKLDEMEDEMDRLSAERDNLRCLMSDAAVGAATDVICTIARAGCEDRVEVVNKDESRSVEIRARFRHPAPANRYSSTAYKELMEKWPESGPNSWLTKIVTEIGGKHKFVRGDDAVTVREAWPSDKHCLVEVAFTVDVTGAHFDQARKRCAELTERIEELKSQTKSTIEESRKSYRSPTDLLTELLQRMERVEKAVGTYNKDGNGG